MKKIVLLSGLLLCALTASALAYTSDSVLSHDIREADGTSGQSTNTGAGIKTGHIQDAAVTTNKIADGAITDAKITGLLSTEKLNLGTSSGTVAAGDHTHDTAYQRKYANIIVVAKSGGDFTDPVAALASITDASATNTYLVKIMPGTYQLTATLNVKSYIDIEGSGPGVTKIRRVDGTAGQLLYAYYVTNSEVRSITLESEVTTHSGAGFGPISVAYGEYRMKDLNLSLIGDGSGQGINLYETKAVIKNVTITVSDTTTTATGVIINTGSSAQVDDVTVEAKGAMNYIVGVHFGGTTATVKDLKLVGFNFANSQNIGAYVVDLSPGSESIKFYDSMLVRAGAATGTELMAANSMIDERMLYTPDGLRPLGGTFKVVNCFNSTFDPVNLNN